MIQLTVQDKDKLINEYIQEIYLMTNIYYKDFEILVNKLKDYCYTLTTSNQNTMIILLLTVKQNLKDNFKIEEAFEQAIKEYDIKFQYYKNFGGFI